MGFKWESQSKFGKTLSVVPDMYKCIGIIQFSFCTYDGERPIFDKNKFQFTGGKQPESKTIYRQTKPFRLPFLPTNGIELVNFNLYCEDPKHKEFFANKETYVEISNVIYDCKDRMFYMDLAETFEYSSEEEIDVLGFDLVNPSIDLY